MKAEWANTLGAEYPCPIQPVLCLWGLPSYRGQCLFLTAMLPADVIVAMLCWSTFIEIVVLGLFQCHIWKQYSWVDAESRHSVRPHVLKAQGQNRRVSLTKSFSYEKSGPLLQNGDESQSDPTFGGDTQTDDINLLLSGQRSAHSLWTVSSCSRQWVLLTGWDACKLISLTQLAPN